ncbi:MAG TPA: transporter, partial [Phycisphaerales bacterium]|nr:transporter [Phycisphaerales bacterium]
MKKLLVITLLSLLVQQVIAQEKTEQSATDLAKKTQNPVADLISLPFQFNTFFETGPKGKTQNLLLIQPVIPIELNDDWNFIARPIIPLLE